MMKFSILLKFLLLLGVVVILVLVSGYVWTKSYIRGEDFQEIVTRKIGEKVGGAVTVAPTEWDGWRLKNDKVQIVAARGFQDLEMNRLSLELDSRGLFERVWRISDLNISELSVKLMPHEQTVDSAAVTTPLDEEELRDLKHMSLLWLPRTVELDAVTIDNVRGLYAGSQVGVVWDEVGVQLRRAGQDYLYEVPRGEVSLTAYPELPWQVMSCRGRIKPEAVFLSEAQLSSNGAVLNLTGEKDFQGVGYLQGELRDFPVEHIVPADWKKKLEGELQSTFTATFSSSVAVQGAAQIKEASLSALPALDAIADKTEVQDFRSLEFDTCQMDYSLEKEVLSVDNLLLESEGFLKVTGSYTHSSASSQGELEVGLATAVVAKLPAGTATVFSAEKEGYHWTTVNVSYENGAWKEDLSSRMVVAALRGILGGTGAKAADALETVQEGVQDMMEKEGGKPAEVIDAGQELLKKGVKSLFDLLGQ